MRFSRILCAALCLFSALLAAQTVGPISITSNQCASIGVSPTTAVVGIQVIGTWTGTLQPKGTIQGQTAFNVQVTPSSTTTPQTTITANGAFYVLVAGYSSFQLCGATVGSGTAKVYLNAGNAPAGGAAGAPSTTFSAITPGTNTNGAQVEGTGSSLATTGLGQVQGSQMLLPGGLPTPTAVGVLTGGNIINGHTVAVSYTLNSAAGETLPAQTVTAGMSNATFGAICTSGTACSLTINAPTIPTGYTGYTAYFCDISAALCSAPVKVIACANILTSCTITNGNLNSGTALPTSNTAYALPGSIATNNCPPGVLPSVFLMRSDGTVFGLGGVDSSIATPLASPYGTATICGRIFFNDSGQSIQDASQQGGGPIRNALVSIAHKSGRVTASGGDLDDRALGIRSTDAAVGSPVDYNQFLGTYAEHFVYNPNFTCSPVGNIGVDEDCVAAMRVRSDIEVNTTASIGGIFGLHGTASTDVTPMNVSGCSPCVIGVAGSALQSVVNNQVTSAPYAGVTGVANASSGNSGGAFGAAFWAIPPSTRFASQNIGIYFPSGWNNAGDFTIRADGTAPSRFKGDISFKTISQNAGGLPITGTVSTVGGIGAFQITSITGPTGASVNPVGVTGATSYSYQLVFRDLAGGAVTRNASVITVANGNATLNGSNFNRIQIGSSNFCAQGFSSVDIYRTASAGTPSTTGKIGNFPVTDCTPLFISQTFDDTGLAGDGTAVPAANTTGGMTAAGFVAGTNSVKVATNFTTAASTSLQTITGLTWNLPPSAASYTFHCALSYSQATANVPMAFGIQAATQAPTNIFGNGQIQTNTTAFSASTLATLTTTTATAIVSATPGATATNFTAYLDGTIENPAGANVINVMVSTSNSGDLVTVLRGSYCSIHP